MGQNKNQAQEYEACVVVRRTSFDNDNAVVAIWQPYYGLLWLKFEYTTAYNNRNNNFVAYVYTICLNNESPIIQ